MSSKGLNRRQFLQTSGLATAGAAAVATGGVLAGGVEAWASELSTLNAHEGKTLLQMVRDIYPHDTLSDFYYAGVVSGLDGGAKDDGDLAKLLKDGVTSLDQAMGVNFVNLSEGNRLSVLTGMQDDGFFQKVRGTTVVALYNDPLVWRHFGYEGASSEFGGYIDRGFDDVNWVAAPPDDASPKAG